MLCNYVLKKHRVFEKNDRKGDSIDKAQIKSNTKKWKNNAKKLALKLSKRIKINKSNLWDLIIRFWSEVKQNKCKAS